LWCQGNRHYQERKQRKRLEANFQEYENLKKSENSDII
jgi:hypothetical protein